MPNLEDYGKETYFKNHGYTWDARIQGYVNREEWKIFSKDYIDDHSFDILLANLQEEPFVGHWKVYFNTETPTDVHNVRKHYGVSLGIEPK